ncbi:MAG: hypothetical protein WAO35_11745, partial [Terriglobia bacterium]
RKSRGAVTRAGKARAAAAHLVHGFYSQGRDEVLLALGESPEEYVGLLKSLMADLQPSPGLQTELVSRMVQTLWRMRRAERMQDGLAWKRVQSGLEIDYLEVAPRFLRQQDIYQRLVALGKALQRPNFIPSAAQIAAFEDGFGDDPPDDIRELFPLLRELAKQASKAPGPAGGTGDPVPIPSAQDSPEGESAGQKLRAALGAVSIHYCRIGEELSAETARVRSPENIAALMAPRDKSALLMQRMEDSSLRQLWRLTRIFKMAKQPTGETEAGESST